MRLRIRGLGSIVGVRSVVLCISKGPTATATKDTLHHDVPRMCRVQER